MNGDEHNSRPTPDQANVEHALRYCPAWDGVLGFDTTSYLVVLRSCPPWRNRGTWPSTPSYYTPWTDQDSTAAAIWMQRHGIKVQNVTETVKLVARDYPFHPIRDYLDRLEWDGTTRLDYWLSIYLGAEPCELTEVFGSRFLLSAVARAYEPGCKVDTALFLEGHQGKMKSTALRVLVGDQFFTDELPDIRKKDASIQLHGIWLVELGEVEALRGCQYRQDQAIPFTQH